ncbi:MAG: hypothetical protein DPW14_17565 [Planctomycetes bacterium]|nr:hypothetical protein [Planctomycetota bacterium]
MPESKKTQRNVRISVELERDIQAMAESLHEVGLLPEPNWSAALVMVLMQAKTAGLLDTPPKWYQPPAQAAQSKSARPSRRP